MIRKSAQRFSDKIMRKRIVSDKKLKQQKERE